MMYIETEVFVKKTDLTFLYNIDIEIFQKVKQKITLPPVGIELTITGVEVGCPAYCVYLSSLVSLRQSDPTNCNKAMLY